ncbi:MAG TPA: hypothetical protein DGG94_22050 [Micromonosporaceae bacterium]|nr:hypothetical protein [Micromonosporaceae bacterium]HCU52442.1 hypothetical protein [Micromonosporaceae bacterium]
MAASDQTVAETAESFVSYERMRALHARGLATPLSRFITDHVQYQDRWWIAERGGWHLVIDGALNIMLNTHNTLVDVNAYLG